MGDSYGFCKVSRKEFLSGKSRFIMDKEGWSIEDYNPEYIDIVSDLDREDYLYSLVKPKNGWLNSLEDKELADFIKNTYKQHDEQAFVVTLESVQHAIDVLTELDKKVQSMPCDRKCEAHEIYLSNLEPRKWKYIEEMPPDPDFPNDPKKVYVSSCKENVDIYKLVAEIYGGRTYHYSFPWDNRTACPGASDIIESLNMVIEAMTAPDADEYVFLFTWI